MVAEPASQAAAAPRAVFPGASPLLFPPFQEAPPKAPEAKVVIIIGPVPAIDEGQEAPAGERQEEPCL